MTTRRGFLKALAAVPAAAAVPAQALGFGGAPNIGWAAMGGGGAALAGSAPIAVAECAIGGTAIWAFFNRAEDSERARVRWLDLYRAHRIKARKGLVKREPAKLIWLREELRLKRAAERYPSPPTRLGQAPFYAGRKRVRARINGRVRAFMKRAGFHGLPWEVA